MLESFATRIRDKAAALSFMKRAMKRHGKPRAVVTDGLRSYGAAMREIGNDGRQEVGRWRNNRFAAPIYATLTESDEGSETFTLIWSR